MESVTRKQRFMPGGIPKHVRCYDDGGESIDRYTVIFTGNFAGRQGYCHGLAMNGSPFHPQGFGQHFSYRETIDRPRYSHLGKRIEFSNLPPDCQTCVKQDYVDIWRIA